MSFDGFRPDAPWLVAVSKTLYGGKARARMYQKLAHLVRNGKRVAEAVDNLQARVMKRKSKWDAEAVVLSQVSLGLRSGQPLAAAFHRFVPVTERLLIEAGERSGRLPEALEHAVTIIDASAKLRNTVIKALVMPILTLLAIIVSFYVMGAYVMPKITAQFDPKAWTGAAKGVYEMSNLVTSPWGLVPVVFFILAAVTVGLSIKRWTGNGRAFADRIPPWSLYRLMVGGGWLISLSALIHSGMILTQALHSMRSASVNNPWLADRLGRIIGQMQMGKNLGRAMEGAETGFPDPEIVDDLVTYSDMPEFSDVLHRIGQQWIKDGIAAVELQSMAMNGVLFVVMSAIVGWFSYGVMDIQNQISAQMGAGF